METPESSCLPGLLYALSFRVSILGKDQGSTECRPTEGYGLVFKTS